MEVLQKAFDDLLEAIGIAYPDGEPLRQDQQVAVLKALYTLAVILKLEVNIEAPKQETS